MIAETRSRPTVGNTVVVKGWGAHTLVVVVDSDPSLLVLETPTGARLHVGLRNVVSIDLAANVRPA